MVGSILIQVTFSNQQDKGSRLRAGAWGAQSVTVTVTCLGAQAIFDCGRKVATCSFPESGSLKVYENGLEVGHQCLYTFSILREVQVIPSS